MPPFDDNAGFGAMIMYLTSLCTALSLLADSFNQVLSHGRMNHNDGNGGGRRGVAIKSRGVEEWVGRRPGRRMLLTLLMVGQRGGSWELFGGQRRRERVSGEGSREAWICRWRGIQ